MSMSSDIVFLKKTVQQFNVPPSPLYKTSTSLRVKFDAPARTVPRLGSLKLLSFVYDTIW